MKYSYARLVLILSLIFFSQCKPTVVPIKVPEKEKDIESELPEDCLLIDTKKEILSVFKKGNAIAEFKNIAFGSSGSGIKEKRGDNITPVGKFNIGWITKKTRFKLFIGLNYPSLDYANRGLSRGIIKQKEFDKIRLSLEEGKIPPQNTALGGLIGIHGLGKSNLKIHQLVNWTNGCIALDNKQIEKLKSLIYLGMTVIIR